MIIAENLNLTGLVGFLNEEFKQKQSGKPFTKSDCQQYTRIKKLPSYLGDITIEKTIIGSVKLYKLVKE